ncbi:hypothetical protein [Pseudomonas oryzihabitans]|uniref:hypothetical protein n=1 Tax=Pseudomonas oryzihabitans TaxID=47885 RepID=UPI001642F4CD
MTYTAQIRLRREGLIVYQESQTFERKQTAQAWIRKREAELAEPGALERVRRQGATVRQMIGRYLKEYGGTMGRMRVGLSRSFPRLRAITVMDLACTAVASQSN